MQWCDKSWHDGGESEMEMQVENVKPNIDKTYSSPRWTNEIADCSLPMTLDTYSNYFNQRFEIVGGAKNIKDVDDPHELLAYSIERFATNRSNALADEIAKVAMERMRFE